MSPFRLFGHAMRQALRDAPSGDPGLRARLVERASLPEPGRRRPVLGLALASVAVALAVFGLARTLGSEPLRCARADGRVVAAGDFVAEHDGHLRFSDGSVVTLAEGGSARLARLEGRNVEMSLEQGRLDCAITPGQGIGWRFLAGPYTVEVIGTELEIARAPPSDLRVHVRHGAVAVLGPAQGTRIVVRAGETLEARRGEIVVTSPGRASPQVVALGEENASEQGPAVMETAPAPLPVTAEAAARDRARTAPVPGAAAPSWQALAASGRYREAAAAIDDATRRACLHECEEVELFALADALRLGGRPRPAREAFIAVRDRFSESRSSRVAALRLGLLSRAAPCDAARWFETFVVEAPGDDLAEDARGRIIESRLSCGDRERAQLAAEEYLARHPDGSYAPLAHRVRAPD